VRSRFAVRVNSGGMIAQGHEGSAGAGASGRAITNPAYGSGLVALSGVDP